MHRILFLPDTGYPAGYLVRAGYRMSGRMFVLTTIFLVKYKIIFFKKALTIIVFSKHKRKHNVVTKLIFVHIFLALFEEKISKSLDQLYRTLAGYPVSGLALYPAGQAGRIIRCIPNAYIRIVVGAASHYGSGDTKVVRFFGVPTETLKP
jgi:hypothetical protein